MQFSDRLFNFRLKKMSMFKNITVSFISLLVSCIAIAQNDSTPPPPTFIYHKDFKHILDSTQDAGSNLYYQKLLIRFLNNDSSLSKMETLALMIGFTENPSYKPLEDMEKEIEIFDLNNNGEFADAINQSRVFLQKHPLSLLVLRECSYAYQKVSKRMANDMIFDSSITYNDSAKYFMDLNDKIMEAMIFSGKGRTPEAPIFSLGLADGEYFIPNVGYQIEKKDTEWNKYGHFMEVVTAIDNLTPKKFYFVIQHAKLKIDDDQANEAAGKKKKKSSSKKEKKKSGSKKINSIEAVEKAGVQNAATDSSSATPNVIVPIDSSNTIKKKTSSKKEKKKSSSKTINSFEPVEKVEVPNAATDSSSATPNVIVPIDSSNTIKKKPASKKEKKKSASKTINNIEPVEKVEVPNAVTDSSNATPNVIVPIDSTNTITAP